MQQRLAFLALLLSAISHGTKAQNTFPASGSVGIGTTSPQQRLHVEGSSNQAIFVSTSALGPISGSGQIGYVKALPTADGQRLGYFLTGSRGGANNNYNVAGMLGYAGGAWTSSSRPAYLAFETTAPSTTARAERMRISPEGNVGIGTTTPSYKLQVVGDASISNGLFVGSGGIYGYGGLTNALGVFGSGSDWGMYGTSPGIGVFGASTNNSYGGSFTSGYVGIIAEGGTYGVRGSSSGGWGVWGHSSSSIGAGGTSGTGYGAYGSSSSNVGVYGNSYSSFGLEAHSSTTTAATAYGISGLYAQGSSGYGLYGTSNSGLGGYFYSASYYGIRAATGKSDKNWAGVFDGNVYAFGVYQTSDKNLKKNIEDVSDAIGIINKLKPRSYEFRNDGKLTTMNLPKGKHFGFIAQDLEEILPSLVQEVDAVTSAPLKESMPQPNAPPTVNANGEMTLVPQKAQQAIEEAKVADEKLLIKSINYIELIPLLVKGMQELSRENEELKRQMTELKALHNQDNATSVSVSSAYLEQNAPNPTRGTTTIRYGIPMSASSARLTLSNSKGQLLKTVNINGRGTGQVNVDTSALPAGVYNYSLWIAGREADTKQLVITR